MEKEMILTNGTEEKVVVLGLLREEYYDNNHRLTVKDFQYDITKNGGGVALVFESAYPEITVTKGFAGGTIQCCLLSDRMIDVASQAPALLQPLTAGSSLTFTRNQMNTPFYVYLYLSKEAIGPLTLYHTITVGAGGGSIRFDLVSQGTGGTGV